MVSVLQTVGHKLDTEVMLTLILQRLKAWGQELVSKMPGDLQVRGDGVTLKRDLKDIEISLVK